MNIDIKDITGLEEPLEKLVETISNGIGVVGNHIFEFDAKRTKRIGEAEADSERKKIVARAEGQNEAMAILDRAGKRFALEQYNKQINLENILVKTREDLDSKTVSEEPVENDWTARFLDVAQNISREDLQDVLAKILSGEVQKPGSFSYQTLEVIKYLSQRDLQNFLKFVAVSTDIGVMKLSRDAKESLEKYNLDFSTYMDLASVGLFNHSSTISYSIDLPALTPMILGVGGSVFWISHKEEQKTKKFNFGLYVFSGVGKELRALLFEQAKNEKLDEYIDDFKEEAEKKGFKLVLKNT
jgi:hypothetical protein